MNKIRDIFVGTIITIVISYGISAGLAAVYFNYEYARNNEFVDWVMYGDRVATLKGFIWPYYFFASSPNSVALTHDELMRFGEITPSFENPELKDSNITTARAILQEHAKRTGAPLTKALFDDQVGWTALEFEWRAELSASAATSWDKRAVVKSARYEELSRSILKYDSAEVADADKVLRAVSERQASYTEGNNTRPLSRDMFSGAEHRYRSALSSFNKFVAALSDLLPS